MLNIKVIWRSMSCWCMLV